MATIRKIELLPQPNGKRYVGVTFTPQVPDPAREEDVVAVFHVRTCDTPTLENDAYAAFFVAASRVETRKPYILSDEQEEALSDAAVGKAGEDNGLGWE